MIQEPDTGLYDALNKGIRAATGTIIGHLNSDDCYTPGAFEAVLKAFTPGMEIVSGGAEILEDGHRIKHRYIHEDEIGLTFFNVTAGPLIPNARFISKRLYQLVGLYNLKYRVAADREFLFRALMAAPRATEIEQVLYQYRWHPGSLTFSDNPEREARWREEYLELAEGYLDRKDLTLDAVDGARLWHLRESAQAATRAVLDREWKKAARLWVARLPAQSQLAARLFAAPRRRRAAAMKVSILLPIYNRAHTLPRCLASIRAQTFDGLGVDRGRRRLERRLGGADHRRRAFSPAAASERIAAPARRAIPRSRRRRANSSRSSIPTTSGCRPSWSANSPACRSARPTAAAANTG